MGSILLFAILCIPLPQHWSKDFIKNTEYKPTEHLVERIQAKGGNQASLVKDIEEKMNAKTKELQHDIEKLMTKTKNDFTKELNDFFNKIIAQIFPIFF